MRLHADAQGLFSQLLPGGTTLSGFSEMDEMPSSASHLAKSGWSEGPWPQMPTYLPARQALMARQQLLDGRIALVEVGGQQLQAGVAVQAQGQLGQVVGADGEAVEVLEELSARMALEGTSHIMISAGRSRRA
jgi:hypothetical protein